MSINGISLSLKTKLTFDNQNWNAVGDTTIKDNLFFSRDPNEKSNLLGDVGGAAWHKVNRNNLNGVKISFTPSISLDMNYYGNVKYPQGFAFVFTANPILGSMGEKRSGLGYDGLYNAVAFEFDFLQNSDKNDIRDPHFSAHYNINGQISSATPATCTKICNIKLGNFYDIQKELYQKDMPYSIEIYGGKLYVYENGIPIINGESFQFLDQLMEQNEVYFGVTSSMNLYKSVTIKNLEVSKIANSNNPIISLPVAKSSFDAGVPLEMNLFINSSCGTRLKVFSQEFLKLLTLKVNSKPWDNISVTFNSAIYGLSVIANNLTKASKNVITPIWKGIEGNTLEISINAGEVTKYDICEPTYNKDNILDTSTSNRFIDRTFSFTICSTDQFKNPKISPHRTDDELVKIGYPFSIPSAVPLKIVALEDKTRYRVTVSLTGIGKYTIYNEQFLLGANKYFEVKVGGVDTESSYAEINNYIENRNAKVDRQVLLYINLKDVYGNSISSTLLDSLSCSFKDSVVEQAFQGKVNSFGYTFPNDKIPITDGLPSLVFTPTTPGEYVFKPRIKCGNDKNYVDVKCALCKFYISTSIPDTTKFKVFSDFNNAFYLSTEAKPLYISMDENKNIKLTTIRFLDTSGIEIPIQIADATKIIADIKNTQGNSVTKVISKFNPSGSVDLFLESEKDRTALFSPLLYYYLTISINDNNYKLSPDSSIPVQFAYKDDYLNNVNLINSVEVPENFIAVYLPGTFTIRASSNTLLFKIVARNSNKDLTMGTGLDPTKVSLVAVDNQNYKFDLKTTSTKIGIFLYVSGSPTQAGSYTVDVIYDGKKIQTVPITVTARYEVADLKYNEKSDVIKSIQDKNIILKDAEVGKTITFTMTMVDILGNVINDNYLSIFNSISVTSTNDMTVNPLPDGSLSIVSSSRNIASSNIKLTLSNGVAYTFTLNRFSVSIDPSFSNSEITSLLSSAQPGKPAQVKLRVADKYNNDISSIINKDDTALKAFKTDMSVYLINNSNEYILLSFDSFNDGFIYTSAANAISKSGEYKLKSYYKNVLIPCSVCYSNYLPLDIDLTNTAAFVVGHKSNYRLYTDTRYQLITTSDNLSFYLIFKDKFGNEVNNPDAQYDLSLTPEINSSSSSLVKLCKISQDNKKRQYYQVCAGDSLKAYSTLKKGKYVIQVDGNKFKLNIDDTYYENESTAVAPSVNSYLRNENSIVIGSVDSPGRVVIDFRSDNYLRFSNLDAAKVSIVPDQDASKPAPTISVKVFYGPLKGLVTAFVSTNNLGTFNFSVKYGDTIIIKNLQYSNTPGKLSTIQYIDQQITYSDSRYFFFQALDANNSKCGFNTDTQLSKYLINIKSAKYGNTISSLNDYNPLTGIFTINIDSAIDGVLTFDSIFLKSSYETTIINPFDINKSFAYLDSDTDTSINTPTTLKFQGVDSYRNYLPYSAFKFETDKFSVMIIQTTSVSTKLVTTLKPPQAGNDTKDIVINYTFAQPGDYLFIPLYNNSQMICTSCRRIVTAGSVSIANTGLQIRTANVWNDKTVNMVYKLFQNSYPFFKVTFKDSSNYSVNNVNIKDFAFEFWAYDAANANVDQLPVEVYQSKQGVYVYFTDDGRQKYLQLKPLQTVKLLIRNIPTKDAVEFINFVVLNSAKDTINTSTCANDAVPTFDDTNRKYSLTAGSDLILDLALKGCVSQESALFNTGFNIKSASTLFNFKVIPAENNGKYLLILTGNTAVDSTPIAFNYKDSAESQKLFVSITPDNKINKFTFSSAGTFDTNQLHGYFYILVNDAYNNVITRDQTMFFYNDIFVDIKDSSGNRIPYMVTFNTVQNMFQVQFAISQSDDILVNSKYSSGPFTIPIKPSTDLSQSLAVVSKSEGTTKAYDVKISLRDSRYKTFTNKDIQLTNEFTFKYFTYNSFSGESYFTDIDISNIKQNAKDPSILTIVPPADLPQYTYSLIIPYTSGVYNLPCSTCLIYNSAGASSYAFHTDNASNDYYISPSDIISSRERFIYITDSASKADSAKLGEVTLQTLSVPFSSGRFIIFTGFDSVTQQTPININNLSIIGQTVPILFDNSATPASSADIDASQSRIYSRSSLSYTAGGKAYIFVELRDKSRIPSSNFAAFALTSDDIKFNVIKSSSTGLYLIEIITDTISKVNSFKVKINGSEIPTPVSLDVRSGYPVSLSINTQTSIDWYTVQHTLISVDSYNNVVCDDRLNLAAKSGNQLVQRDIYLQSKSCKGLFFFSGSVVLSSPLFKTSQNIENYSQVKVSSFTSSLNIDQNNSQIANSKIVFTLNLISISDFVFPTNTSKSGISFKIYSLHGYNSKRVVKVIDSISSMTNSFTMDQLGIVSHGDYLITAVVDGCELRKFVPFRYYRSFIQEPKSMEIKVKIGNNDYKSVINVLDTGTTPVNPNTNPAVNTLNAFNFPYSFVQSYTNSDNQKISIPSESKLEVKLLLNTADKNELMTYETNVNTETTYLINIPKDKINFYMHLPKGTYIISFKGTFKSTVIEKWILINIEAFKFHRANLVVPYSLPNAPLTEPLDIVSIGNEKVINTNAGSYSKANLCVKTKDSIYNEYLDPNKLSITDLDTNNCNLYTSIFFRGCIELSLLCKKVAPTTDGYKISLSYNNIKLNQLNVYIDPVLPPSKVNVISAFPTTIQQKSEITAQFNLLDSNGSIFMYLNSENFEVFINNMKLSTDKWQLWFNKNLQLKLLSIDYPPRIQKIEVYFKDSTGVFTRLPELSTTLNVSQGSLDTKKTSLVLPVSYYAGNTLSFVILIKDSYSNCFEDDVDSTKFIIKLTKPDGEFKDFIITQENIDFVLCRRRLQVTTKTGESPLKSTGEFPIEVSYSGNSVATAKIVVLANLLSPEKSVFNVVNFGTVPVVQVKAGQKITIEMTGTDAFSNKLSYTDLVDRLNAGISSLTRDKDYFFSSRIGDTKSNIIMGLTINSLGRFQVNYTIDNTPFINQNGLKEVYVSPGQCSNRYPKIKLANNVLYTGNYGTIVVECLDDFNNTVSTKTNEIFNFEIKGQNLAIVAEDKLPYELSFNAGIYTSRFLVAYDGVYTVQIYLNGQRYGNTFNITVLPQKCPEENPVMCSNKLCVKTMSNCTADTDNNNCKEADKPFYCSVKGTKICVDRTTDCDCSSGFKKCNGMCFPDNFTSACDSPIITNCQRKMGQDGFISCPDGSCRSANSKCPSPLGCPLGYKPCGSSCINRNSTCVVDIPKCLSTEVMCWDMTCADSLDNCPTGKTCKNVNDVVCPDGKCVQLQSQCTQPPTCVTPFSFLCPDFTCKKSKLDCIKRRVCFPGESLCDNNSCAIDCSKVTPCASDKFLCPTGQCVTDTLLCPTSISCPTGTIKCPSGSCAMNFAACKFVSASNSLSCPLTAPILCADLSCVTDISMCKNLVDCPATTPFRCPNNECKRSADNCASATTCPSQYPVLCSDGTCQKASYHCVSSSSTDSYIICQNKVRCADGSCVKSISLCPNQVSCGEDKIKCWDGACVKDISECRDPKYIACPDNFSFRCPDGSCRKDKSSCSTVSVCPRNKPVKCWDNSCREHIKFCPKYQSCGQNMKSCPDGTCSNDKCNTIVTCPPNRPFLCYDNSCKADLRDCPVMPSCAVLCPDGTCVSNRQLCKFFDPCPPLNPVRCQQGSCANSVTSCDSIQRECPIGFVKCKTGGCRSNEGLCDPFKCPSNFPVLCDEGVCVEKIEYCDNKETACPFNLPFKCLDGTCIDDPAKCLKRNNVQCIQGQVLCLDGSCRRNFNDCPLKNGCTNEKPLKCADGTCINKLEGMTCSPPICPFGFPIKCDNGQCVMTSSECPSTIREEDYSDCAKQNLKGIMCADGRCVPTPSYCRALYQCPIGYTRCSDGSCKLSSPLCPSSSNCPDVRPFRCTTGKCVTKESECNNRCPKEYPTRCDKTGECVKDSMQCPGTEKTANGCPANKMFKCLDGRCFDKEEKCKSVSLACDENFPVLCPDGTCTDKRESCVGKPDTCQNGYDRCPDGTCVEKSKFYVSCKNKIGCPLVKPIRCADGSCAIDDYSCNSTIACSSSNPVLCADLSCKSDANFCNILYPCPVEKPYRCDNGYCVKKQNECESISLYCPLSSPIRCSTGRCVQHILECSNEFYIEECKSNQFFCPMTGTCVQGAKECSLLKIGNSAGSVTSRVLQGNTNSTSINVSPLVDPGCTSGKPRACYDGTCRETGDACDLLPACKFGEYRCKGGSCEKDQTKCSAFEFTCPAGSTICPDGVCRIKKCVPYNGCSLDAPYQCTNGQCVKNQLECIGYSMCPNPTEPFRCIDGTCVTDPSTCPEIKRLISVKTVSMAISILNQIDVEYAFDTYKKNIARVVIPGNSLQTNNSYANIFINEIPQSILKTFSYNNSMAIITNVSNGILSSDGRLNGENSVMSPVFSIFSSAISSSSNSSDVLNINGQITIEHNYYLSNKFLPSDYCLARLETNDYSTVWDDYGDLVLKDCINLQDCYPYWNCVTRKTSDDQTTFNFNKFGVYSVVLIPNRGMKYFDPDQGTNFFFQNIKIVAIVLSSLFIFSVLVFYIFTRVIRYREKYKELKDKHINMLNEKEDYKMMSTDIPGQTLGDTVKGIVFTKNPAHSVADAVKGTATDLENEIEELQRKCRSVESQNKTMEQKIQDVNDQYRMLKSEIDKIKNY